MTDNHAFCRSHLKLVMADVRKVTTAAERKTVWAYKNRYGSDFHGPGDFYWYDSDPHCLWSLRAEAWGVWMREKGHEK
jgi:hypothetical protein